MRKIILLIGCVSILLLSRNESGVDAKIGNVTAFYQKYFDEYEAMLHCVRDAKNKAEFVAAFPEPKP